MSIQDIIEAASPSPWRLVTDGLYDATVKDSRGEYIASYSDDSALSFADAHFIATFDPEHVALMEAVCEAAKARHQEWTRDTYIAIDDAIAALQAYRKTHGYGD